ncbi:type II secretion system F family protein [Taylorella equigenitalis]|uniref:Type II secretion system protein n=1 Tax=Taylorella equigenitalis 14/56 TaxID=1091497 RepID=I7IIS2_9BURK|nr:type II secretion system F family protein [Taylorella equigenitalis]ASY37912.1 pilus assembly protein TadB [Taylorella equigenitalis]ASY42333.1 pilus assembly protein TadB [Taylorella equigenitalis]KGK32932.1 pilus assembly protein TadB [Taylorella equigenitalis]RBA26025.1 pilus assembly protein TadB [Taylorella equigenitalis]WDU45756.1 type II secretion system F family protein [Taylorella equigenitalis]
MDYFIFILAISLTLVFVVLFWIGSKILDRYKKTFNMSLGQSLWESFILIPSSKIWTMAAVASVCVGLFIYLLTQSWMFSIVFAVVILILPPLGAKWLIKKRQKKLIQQFPDFLLSLSNALKSGAGLQHSIKLINETSEKPISQEFALFLHQIRLGSSVEESLTVLLQRNPSMNMSQFVTLVKVSYKTGGNLANMLEVLSTNMRENNLLIKKIDALTSQSRMQSWIMTLLPIFLLMVLSVVAPNLTNYFWEHKYGYFALALIVIMEIGGFLTMKKLMKIRVI